MAELPSQPEQMPEENGFIDLTDSMNSATLEEIKQQGAVGAFVEKLVAKGIAEKQKVLIQGMNSLTLKVRYGKEEISFMLKPSVDQGDEPVSHAHYEMRMIDYKKPWVREFINAEESGEWLKVLPINFANFCEELAGKDLRLFTLEEQFPKLTYGNMRDVIADETRELDRLFDYNPTRNAGAWGFYMEFKSPEMHQKYLADDPALMAQLKAIVDAFIPNIMGRLKKLNEDKKAA